MSNNKPVSLELATPTGPAVFSLTQTGADTATLVLAGSSHELHSIVIAGNKVTCTTQVVFWSVHITLQLVKATSGLFLLSVTIAGAPANDGTTQYELTAQQYAEVEAFVKNF